MKIVCGPSNFPFPDGNDHLPAVLFRSSTNRDVASAGNPIHHLFEKKKLSPSQTAWDFLAIALAVQVADYAGHRQLSPDGWTRDFDVVIAVSNPEIWEPCREDLEEALRFLTTDRWLLHFVGEGSPAPKPQNSNCLLGDSVTLLSGGLDSLIGAIDLVSDGQRPVAVSQIVRGDADKQDAFARQLGLPHVAMNHNVSVPNQENPPTQRARSLIFLAEAVAVCSTLEAFGKGGDIPLFVCENGFISINPPLTPTRIGSLSTRTTHPVFIRKIQSVLDRVHLPVRALNPYQFKTKGEMLTDCKNQPLIRRLATKSTSCGRFKIFGYKHCGRCVPCQVRRAAFIRAGLRDDTDYVYEDLGKQDADHAKFDDVRSVAMAISTVEVDGLSEWIGSALCSSPSGDQLREVLGRGLAELETLHQRYDVQ